MMKLFGQVPRLAEQALETAAAEERLLLLPDIRVQPFESLIDEALVSGMNQDQGTHSRRKPASTVNKVGLLQRVSRLPDGAEDQVLNVPVDHRDVAAITTRHRVWLVSRPTCLVGRPSTEPTHGSILATA